MTRPFGEKSHLYDSSEFTAPLNTTNYDVASNNASFCANAKIASGQRACGRIRLVTDQTITIKLNLTTNPAITITSSESPFFIDDVVINNVFITNTTATNIKLLQLYI